MNKKFVKAFDSIEEEIYKMTDEEFFKFFYERSETYRSIVLDELLTLNYNIKISISSNTTEILESCQTTSDYFAVSDDSMQSFNTEEGCEKCKAA